MSSSGEDEFHRRLKARQSEMARLNERVQQDRNIRAQQENAAEEQCSHIRSVMRALAAEAARDPRPLLIPVYRVTPGIFGRDKYTPAGEGWPIISYFHPGYPSEPFALDSGGVNAGIVLHKDGTCSYYEKRPRRHEGVLITHFYGRVASSDPLQLRTTGERDLILNALVDFAAIYNFQIASLSCRVRRTAWRRLRAAARTGPGRSGLSGTPGGLPRCCP
jgi:hypothetical protein